MIFGSSWRVSEGVRTRLSCGWTSRSPIRKSALGRGSPAKGSCGATVMNEGPPDILRFAGATVAGAERSAREEPRRGSSGRGRTRDTLGSWDHTGGAVRGNRIRDDLQHAAIKSRKPSSSGQRQSQKVGVHDLPVSDQPPAGHEPRGTERRVVGPEHVSRHPDDPFEDGKSLGRQPGIGKHAIIGGNPYESRLSHRTGRPALGPGLSEPAVDRLVVNMVRPRQRHEDVDVEKRDHSSSSSALRTVSSLIGGASERIRKTGKPPLRAGLFGASPLRARLETTRPRLVS